MDRGYAEGVVGAAPSPTGWTAGYPTDGDPLVPTAPTIPGAYWFHMITESLVRVIEAAGLDPDHANLDLLKDAIAAIAFPVASIADQVAGTAIDKAVTSGRQKYHVLHPKKMIRFEGRGSDGACTINANVGGAARAERKGEGYYRVLFSTSGSDDDMADGHYVAIVMPQKAGSVPAAVGAWGASISATTSYAPSVTICAQDATGFVFKCEGNGAGSAKDVDYYSVLILGALP